MNEGQAQGEKAQGGADEQSRIGDPDLAGLSPGGVGDSGGEREKDEPQRPTQQTKARDGVAQGRHTQQADEQCSAERRRDEAEGGAHSSPPISPVAFGPPRTSSSRTRRENPKN